MRMLYNLSDLLTNNDSALRHNQLAADVLLCRQGKSKRNRSTLPMNIERMSITFEKGGANRQVEPLDTPTIRKADTASR